MKRIQTTFRALFIALLIPALGASAQDVSRTYDASPGDILRLDIETGGSITIKGWDIDKVEINVTVRGRDGSDVIVDLDEIRDGISVSTEYEGRNGQSDVDIDIRVPSVYDLDLETTGGDVRIDNVEGRIEGQTMGGDLDFSGLRGTIEFSTMGGSVTLENSVIDGSVQTMGGEVLLQDVIGNVNGQTMGGEVTYRNVRSNPDSPNQDELKISTMGGEINVDEALNGATVHTMGGDIRVRSAADHVKATTMGGEIEIDEISGWVEATTMGGDVEVHMVGNPDSGDRHVDISSMGGEITLTVPQGLSMDIDLEIKFDDRRNGGDYQIISDFDLTREQKGNSGSRSRRGQKTISATGTVGSGKNKIKIRTVGGNIILKKGR